jgi:hypothetical protein
MTHNDDRVVWGRRSIKVVLVSLVEKTVLDTIRVEGVPSTVGDVNGQISTLEQMAPLEHAWTGSNYHP